MPAELGCFPRMDGTASEPEQVTDVRRSLYGPARQDHRQAMGLPFTTGSVPDKIDPTQKIDCFDRLGSSWGFGCLPRRCTVKSHGRSTHKARTTEASLGGLLQPSGEVAPLQSDMSSGADVSD